MTKGKKKFMTKLLKLIFILLISCQPVVAVSFDSVNSSLVGKILVIDSIFGDTLSDIARRFDLGQLEIFKANPNLAKSSILKPGTKVNIPQQYLIPAVKKDGLILNLPEMRIYYFNSKTNKVVTYPVAIGKLGWSTPIANAKIIGKNKDPSWVPPNSMRKSYARIGKSLPKFVAAGPYNPLGQYALKSSLPKILIHATNHTKSVGLRSSHGCIRMYPEDIKELFETIAINTSFKIIHLPYKVAFINGVAYLEAHTPLKGGYYKNIGTDVKAIITSIVPGNYAIGWEKVEKIIQDCSGCPERI